MCTKGNVFLYEIYAVLHECMLCELVNRHSHKHVLHIQQHTYTHTRGLHACVYTQHKKEREAHRRTREALRATEDDHKKLKESKLYCLGEDVYTCIHLVYIVVGRMYTCIILKD